MKRIETGVFTRYFLFLIVSAALSGGGQLPLRLKPRRIPQPAKLRIPQR